MAVCALASVYQGHREAPIPTDGMRDEKVLFGVCGSLIVEE